jgi:hypothetical protein
MSDHHILIPYSGGRLLMNVVNVVLYTAWMV